MFPGRAVVGWFFRLRHSDPTALSFQSSRGHDSAGDASPPKLVSYPSFDAFGRIA
jgi:hypothetical protein